MKEIKQQDKDQIKIHKQAEIQKGLKYLGSTRIRPGHTLWEYNFVTGEIDKAKMDAQVIVTGDGQKVRKKVEVKENCQYIGALNRKNLIRKLRRHGFYVKEA